MRVTICLLGICLLATKAAAGPQDSQVKVGQDGFLRVAERPEFVIGIYNAGRYDEMARAGFNATHNYAVSEGEAGELPNSRDARLKTLLDKNQTNGLRMMVELPRKAIERGDWNQIRRRIETFRNHPGLLCWGSEERVARGRTGLTNMAALYQLVHSLDPNHPLVLGDTKDVIKKLQTDRRDFFPDACMDIGIWWWYPIPLKDPDGNGLTSPKTNLWLNPPSWLTTTWSKKPLWIAIQSYQHPTKDARFPTPAEYRCMAYLSIINGVKGIFFYTGSGQKDFQGKPSGILNKPEEGHWDYVKTLAHELHEASPIIMAPVAEARPSVSPATAPIEFTQRFYAGKYYLIAANKSDHSQSISFSGEMFRNHHARVQFEDHSVTNNDGVIKDEFSPFAVHVYCLN